MEGDVVLGHELTKSHFRGVLPPLPPLVGVAGRDGNVPAERITQSTHVVWICGMLCGQIKVS